MTREERIEKLRHLITCMKCEVSGKPCDNNCPTQYDAGNMGEIIENLEEIAKALEQEPCEDTISRQAVLDAIDAKAWEFCDYLISEGRNDEQKPVSHFADNLREFISEELPPATSQPNTGHWIESAEEYYKAVNEYGDGVNEGTEYFIDDIACPKCLSKFSVIDNETERFKCCPNCGAKMGEEAEE